MMEVERIERGLSGILFMGVFIVVWTNYFALCVNIPPNSANKPLK